MAGENQNKQLCARDLKSKLQPAVVKVVWDLIRRKISTRKKKRASPGKQWRLSEKVFLLEIKEAKKLN